MSEDNNSNNNFISLQSNGRIFPTWVLYNFKKYKMLPIEKVDGSDPCKNRNKGDEIELTLYQKFLGSFLDYRSPFRDILIYHGLGSGKTATAINIYNILYNYTPAWNVFLLIKASLRDSQWIGELKKFLSKEDYNGRRANIEFIHYDSPYADRDFIKKIKEVDSSKKSLYIFDEAHNFIRNVYNNLTSKKGKRAQVIYDYIVQDKKENEQSRVILLSGTPAINSPYELALVFNLLRPGSFPKNENKFNDLYITSGRIKMLNSSTKNMFQRRVLGLVSYYIGSTKDLFAEKKLIYKDIVMDKYQQEVYEVYEAIEARLEAARIKGQSQNKTYKTYTRQTSNFVFPFITERVNGEKRPRPGQFRINDIDGERLLEGKSEKLKEQLLNKEYVTNIELYLKTIGDFVHQTEIYFDRINENDKSIGNTIQNDIEAFKTTYEYSYSKFMIEHKNKSNLFKQLYACSCKFISAVFYSLKSKGPILVFSNYVKMEGLEIFKLYLKYIGVEKFSKETSKDYLRYVEYHGEIDQDQRNKNKDTFNLLDNKEGKIIKYILVAPAGAEGISLRNVRQIHILDPYWNEVRIEQLIGRGIRMCSHEDLPIEDRKVEVYRYKAVRENGKKTTDEEVEEGAKEKQTLIDSFLKTVKEVAVDCELFKSVNMLDEKYNCFQFNEASLFDQYIGPAFKEDAEYDMKFNNGLNSSNSDLKRIKVIKIDAVERLDENNFTNKKKYWYYPDSGVVYDYDLDFPIGKINKVDNNPEKIDDSTYVISQVINIPNIKNVI